jgi:hypothetical protein
MAAKKAEQGALFDDPGERRAVIRQRRAVEVTLSALRSTGRLELVDASLVAQFRTTADLADELRRDPERTWHLMAALKLLGEQEARLRQLAGPHDDDFAALLSAAAGPAPALDAR